MKLASKPKIIVLDDERSVRDTFVLSFPEFHIIPTSSVFELLHILRSKNCIDLIVLDVVMPGINGLQVLRQIKEMKRGYKVVICTAYGNKETVIEALRLGADDYIEKPFNVDEVKQIFRHLICPETDKMLASRLEMAREYLRNHYKDQVSLQELAEKCSLSPKYFSRLFKEKFGKSFTEMRLDIRMNLAKDLLINSELSIQEVAFEVGYQSPEAFSKAFKELNGISPKEYRQLFWEQEIENAS